MGFVRKTRNKIDLLLDGDVSAGATDLTALAVIPAGERWRVVRFGGSDVASGDGIASVIALQLKDGSPPAWSTVRAFALVGNAFDLQDVGEVVGDGVRQLRIVRQNKSAIVKPIVAWIEGYKVG